MYVETLAVGGRLPCGAQRLQGRGWTRKPHVGTSSSQGQCSLSRATFLMYMRTLLSLSKQVTSLVTLAMQFQARNFGCCKRYFHTQYVNAGGASQSYPDEHEMHAHAM